MRNSIYLMQSCAEKEAKEVEEEKEEAKKALFDPIGSMEGQRDQARRILFVNKKTSERSIHLVIWFVCLMVFSLLLGW